MRGISNAVQAIVIAGVLLAGRNSPAQNTASPKGEVVLVKLATPAYPPLARQTWISGDVQVVVEVRRDGGVATTTVIQGHPLLAQAALDSVKQSQFECTNCPEAGLSLRLIYTFELEVHHCVEPSASQGKPEQLPKVTQLQNHITVSDSVRAWCNPGTLGGLEEEPRRVRSIKCLYLWRCGRPRIIGVE
jgi:hypothetical protein